MPFTRKVDIEMLEDFAVNNSIDLLMCSVYTWNHDEMVELVREFKKRRPRVKILFGGPHVMTLHEKQGYFQKYPFIDIAVLGDGEEPAQMMLDHWIEKGMDSKVRVNGVAYKGDEENSSYRPNRCLLVQNCYPYLDLEEDFNQTAENFRNFCNSENLMANIVIDTNRGCPYACTNCDWGGNSMNKVVKRKTERLFDQLELVLKNKFDVLEFADANFGMYERDLDIVKYVADYKMKYGYPKKEISYSLAKNHQAIPRMIEMTKIGFKANIHPFYRVHLQDFNEKVLSDIKRKNLSFEQIKQIKEALDEDGIPSRTQFIIGLPGQNKKNILEANYALMQLNLVTNNSNMLISLPGSEMEDPAYQKKYGLKTANLTMDENTSIPIRALTDYEYERCSKDRIPVYHFERWQYQKYIIGSYSYDQNDFVEMWIIDKLLTVFEHCYVMKPFRIICTRHGIKTEDFYNSIFDDLEQFEIFKLIIEKGRQQLKNWLSGKDKFMKIHDYSGTKIPKLEFAMNFMNFALFTILLNKDLLYKDYKKYFSRHLDEKCIDDLINIIDLLLVDDGIIRNHDKSVSVQDTKFERIVDPDIHKWQIYDEKERSMFFETCWDLKLQKNLYKKLKYNDKEIRFDELDHYLEKFYEIE